MFTLLLQIMSSTTISDVSYPPDEKYPVKVTNHDYESVDGVRWLTDSAVYFGLTSVTKTSKIIAVTDSLFIESLKVCSIKLNIESEVGSTSNSGTPHKLL